MIVRGELPSGQWLRKREMAERLRMSPTPVVEAFRRLELEGLVETEPQWGTRVRVFTVPEIFELAGMRVVLEGLVARCCAERLTDHQILTMRVRAAELDEIDSTLSDPAIASARGNATSLDEDIAFHSDLAEAASLSLVRREIVRLNVLEATCRLWQTPAIPTTVTHQEILDSIASRNPQAAEAAMRRHIQDNVDAYMPRLRSKFGDGRIEITPVPH
jgi:DNA-binding GntR family transcriptional regulator